MSLSTLDFLFGNKRAVLADKGGTIVGLAASGAPQPVGVVAAVAASVTLTFAAKPTSGDTFTIGGQTYRVMTTPAAAYDVQLGASAGATGAAETLDNIKLATNASGTAGTHYYAGTVANPNVVATTNTDTTQLFVARAPGVVGNLIPATETFTNGSNVFSAALLSGGAEAALRVEPTTTRLEYETVAAGATAQALGGTGAAGDYLSHVVFQPLTTGAGTSLILDNSTSATVFTYTAGTLSDLRPIVHPVGAVSVAGPWKITTGADMTATAYGRFTA